MKTLWKAAGMFALAAASSAACGGGSSGDNVTCGPGTKLDASVCYVETAHPVDASVVHDGNTQTDAVADAAADAVSTPQSGVVFAGVAAVAPASATALYLAWVPAVDAGMADAT